MQRLTQFLKQDETPADLIELINLLMSACKEVNSKLQNGALEGILGSAEHENVQGEVQKKLDVIANDIIKLTLSQSALVRGMASEEEEHSVAADLDGKFLVTFDPLDGSSNIDVNVSVGTIFSILPAPKDATGCKDEDFLQPGNQQIAAGYVLYGPSCLLVLTTGNGVDVFTLGHNGEFYLTREKIQIPETTREFAINMSNQRFWDKPVQDYISDLLQGEDGPRGKRYNMRWVASMVAEVHRILTRGGVFLYPWDSREPKKPGKLRLMYEGNPMSMLVEQAGGRSVNTQKEIVDVEPQNIHERVSVVLGSKEEVDAVMDYHKNA
ncbi:MAG: class 1 fructose-bisphosphatase [Motiliproteus sp.]|nr:class 1 fructose-bisphosphatase [Motiliproteus sp.]MCW9052591.1 class 1 fructose-bisphosphatase [Motiliproteus sp.]